MTQTIINHLPTYENLSVYILLVKELDFDHCVCFNNLYDKQAKIPLSNFLGSLQQQNLQDQLRRECI